MNIKREITSKLGNNNNYYLYCNDDTYHDSNLNIKLNSRGVCVFYKWQEHVQVMDKEY